MMKKIITYSFCDPYLDKLADYLEDNYLKKNKDISRLAIVFGGKRPVLFLKRELAKRIETSFYPPQFFSIDEFISHVVKKHEPFKATLDLDSCYLLYKIAQEETPEILKGRESFSQFLPWTKEILAFIDQLDLENVDDERLRHIESNAQIGYAVPKDINRLLENIVILRKAYHQSLLEKKIYSRGLQYLRAAQVIDQVSFDEFDQILFCNFFYFNRSEEKVIESLYKRDQATLLFQGDERKWPVLKRIARKLECSLFEADEPIPPKFSLKLYESFDVHSQVGLVREILKGIENLDQTVVVLPDSDHIIPLISEIAVVAKEFNISMGYPLKRSSLYSLVEFIFKAQLSKKEKRYYTKDYLKVLRHPFVKNLKISTQPAATRILIHKIEEILTGKEKTHISGSSFIELDDIESCDELYMLTLEMLDRLGIETNREELLATLEEIHQLFFMDWEAIRNFKVFSSVLERLLDELIHKSFMQNYPLNLNIATKMYAIKDELVAANFNAEEFTSEEVFRIFDNKVSGEMVAFVGSPLKGLQILGLFETRSLNFENVIVMDVNEGSLPKLSIYEPLIPREVMISLNLDRLELEDEIQRYQFMRLISSAQNVHLVYQKSKDKEKSRFIEELIWDEQKKKNRLDVISTTRASFEVKVVPKKIVVKKTPQMIEALKKHRFSASSINMYLRNPLEFYYSYVLGLREKEDLLDEPEARQVGTFIHSLLEESFKPFLNKKPEINAAFRKRFTTLFEKQFDDSFVKVMRADSFLIRSVMEERLKRFWENEEANPERDVAKILHLETRFEDIIPLSCGNIHFAYIVDRVDELKDGTIMIIDYKTGGIDQMPKAIDRISSMELSRESIRDNIRSFQIPLYFHYLHPQFKSRPINAALYNLRTLELHKFIDDRTTFNRDQINEVFLRALDFIMCEILDPKVDFVEDVSVAKGAW